MGIDLRSKHVAHSVNPFETISIGAMVGALGTEEPKVTGMAAVAAATWAPGRTSVVSLGRMATVLLSRIADQIQEQTPGVIQSAELLGLEELRKLPLITYRDPKPDEAGTARQE